MLTTLPLARWTVCRSGGALLMQATDLDVDEREATLRRWAAALGAEVSVEGEILTAAARRGHRGAVEVLLSSDLSE